MRCGGQDLHNARSSQQNNLSGKDFCAEVIEMALGFREQGTQQNSDSKCIVKLVEWCSNTCLS